MIPIEDTIDEIKNDLDEFFRTILLKDYKNIIDYVKDIETGKEIFFKMFQLILVKKIELLKEESEQYNISKIRTIEELIKNIGDFKSKIFY